MDIQYLQQTIEPYLEYLPYFGAAAVIAFAITPLVGYFVKKLGLHDLSATEMKSGEKNLLQQINKTISLRGGGVAVVIPFVLLLVFGGHLDKQIAAIIISVLILTLGGLYDDKYRSSYITQLVPQILAAVIVVAAGISIDSIQNPLDTSLNLRWMTIPFAIGVQDYSFAFPADIITIVWIIMIIQGLNWTFGINALGEGISIIVFTTILAISIKFGTPISALLSAIVAGGLIGFLPFTLYPAKIFSGSAGTNVYGFLIAVLSILGGVKVSTSVIVLIIPLIDMLWVMVGRINRQGVSGIRDTIKVATAGDHTHLHHRLLKLGFSVPQVNLIEWIAVGICAILAFSLGDLPKVTIIAIIGVLVLLFFFVISLLLKRGVSVQRKKPVEEGDVPPRDPTDTPESRYAY